MEETRAQLEQQYDEVYADRHDIDFVLNKLDMQPDKNTVNLKVANVNVIGRIRVSVLKEALQAHQLELEEQCSLLKSKINKLT